MYVFSRAFFKDFVLNPGDLLLTLKRRKTHFTFHIVRFLLFWRITFSEYALNHCITRSCALAYALLLTIIPLVTTAAFMVSGFIEVQPEHIRQFFKFLLPFAPDTVLEYIALFFVNARKLRGVGIIVLIVVAVGLFGGVEESFNTIWKVTRSRSIFVRMRTFTMVMVYSPLLFLMSFQFRRSQWFDLLSGHFLPLDAVPFLLMMLAFSSLIAFVPNTRVNFSSACIGGLLAAVLFEAERRCFAMFVLMSIQTQTIYGAVGMLPLFLISLFLAALITLFGAQVAYAVQNFRPLLRAKKRWDRRVGDYKTYITFRIMLDCVEAFHRKGHPPALLYFCTKYELSDMQALGILHWLIHEGFLHTVGGRKVAYVPTRDFMQTPVKEVLDAIENQNRRIPSSPDDPARDIVGNIITKMAISCSEHMRNITFAQLIERLDASSPKRAGRRAARNETHRSLFSLIVFLFFLHAPVSALDSLVVMLPHDVPLTMIKIPQGPFMMGSNEPAGSVWNTCDWNPPCDKPVHNVTIAYDFYIGKYEVTNRQWKAVMDTIPSFNAGCLECPVEQVDWNDCRLFCEKLRGLHLGLFRLPSEAEWEYACRAGTTTRFFFGDSGCTPATNDSCVLNEYAWWSNNNPGHVQPVGMKKPNPWGLYDVLGNVYEWCLDNWKTDYTTAPIDGSPWLKDSTIEKVTRGSWRGYSEPRKYRSAFRANHADTLRHGCCGMRLVREIDSSSSIRQLRQSLPHDASFRYVQSGTHTFVFYTKVTTPIRIYNLQGSLIAEIHPVGCNKQYTGMWTAVNTLHAPVRAACYIAVQCGDPCRPLILTVAQ